MKNAIKLHNARNDRMNKLLEMVSQCDWCIEQGFDYEPHESDLELIYRLDSEILELTKYEGI